MGKFAVFSAALRGGETALAIIGILTALVAVFFYLRVVVMLYMKPAGDCGELRSPGLSEIIALAVPTAATLLLGIHPQPLLDLLASIIN